MAIDMNNISSAKLRILKRLYDLRLRVYTHEKQFEKQDFSVNICKKNNSSADIAILGSKIETKHLCEVRVAL